MLAPDFIRPLLAHPVAILGAGVSGRALAALVAHLGARFTVFDSSAPGSSFPAPRSSAFTAADQYGSAASGAVAGRTIVIDSHTRFINVMHGS